MNNIDLRKFDLNLLIVFEVLLVERSVTRAAERLARTQSAISHALSRLRVQLGDPVLVKGGKFMQPTPFALDFLEEVRPILARIQRALSPRHSFDPASSRRIFRLCAPDFALTLFTRLHAHLRVEAPSVAIEWSSLRNSMLLDLVEGQIDVAIAPTPPRLTQDVFADGIGALQWRCFARKGHPAFVKWGPKAWSRWPHLVVRVGAQIENPVDVAIATAGLERTIAGWVPHFSAIAPVLAASDLLTTVPSLCMADRSVPTVLSSGTCLSRSLRCRMRCCGAPVAAMIPRSNGCAIGFGLSSPDESPGFLADEPAAKRAG